MSNIKHFENPRITAFNAISCLLYFIYKFPNKSIELSSSENVCKIKINSLYLRIHNDGDASSCKFSLRILDDTRCRNMYASAFENSSVKYDHSSPFNKWTIFSVELPVDFSKIIKKKFDFSNGLYPYLKHKLKTISKPRNGLSCMLWIKPKFSKLYYPADCTLHLEFTKNCWQWMYVLHDDLPDNDISNDYILTHIIRIIKFLINTLGE